MAGRRNNVVPFRKPFKAVPLKHVAKPRRRPQRFAGKPWWRRVSPIMVALPLAAFTVVFVFGLPTGGALDLPRAGGADREAARFGLCGGMGRAGGDCVIDGDTFWYRGEKIRIADINTP